MKSYKENDLVIYTNAEGKRYDTFVIFDTDAVTGLTHINHDNLRVAAAGLELHPRTFTANANPIEDGLSFNLFLRLKDKYKHLDKEKKQSAPHIAYANDKKLQQAS